jgi:hypothetical protein
MLLGLWTSLEGLWTLRETDLLPKSALDNTFSSTNFGPYCTIFEHF